DGDIGEKVADMLEQQECTVWRVHRSLRFNDSFQKLDHHCYRIRSAQGEDLQQLLDEIESQGGLDGVLDFWSLQEQPVDECQAETIATAVERINFPVVLLIQELTRRALSPRMWLFTHNAWNINPDAIASGAARHSLWGLGRVIRLEHPEFRCSLVDIDKNALCEKQILAELIANTNEQEIRLAAQQRLVARLATAPDEIESKFKASPENNSKQPWQIEWTKDNQITVIPASRPKLQAQQAVVNVRNCVIHAPGTTGDSRLPVNKMGTTLTGGTVESSSVDAVHPGDHIVWIGAKRSTTSSAVLRADEMWVLSPNLYLPDAIASAGPYLAAFYGLIDVAKLQHGDRVLVIADNPLALAAAHVIRWMCAEAIIAIPEGDNGEFRNAGFLDVLDLNAADIDEKLEHYFIHRTADILFFATTEPKDRTPAKYLSDTGHCLWMPFASDARPPRIYGNQTLTSLDIGRSFTHNSHQIRDAWKRVTALLNAGTLPFITMPQFRLSELLEHPDMLNNGHEAVVTLDEVPVTGIHHSVIRSDTTYLIIGGMGGLGLSICKELIESGARSLVLVGRRAASQSARQQINTLMKSGASIITLQGDMSYETDVRRILDYIADHLPPLAGVINSAGLLRDATLLKQDRQLFVQAFPPKVQCAWNLHRLTRDLPLDFFVMFSSAAGLLGSPGQANYATANTFLDGLVYARRAQGLPAQAIQWGAWAEVGLAARPDRNERLAWRGLESFAPEAGAALFTSIVERPEPVLAAMIFKPGRWRRANPGADRDMRYAQLEKPAPSDALPLAIAPVPSHVPEASERKQQMDHTSLLQKLRAEIARIARIPESRIEDNIAITELGFDSLMMVELSASIEQIFNAVIPIPVLMKGPGIKSLSEHISETIGEVETANAPTKPVPADKVQKSATRQQAMGNNSALRQLRNDVARIARIPESRLDNSVSIVHLGFDSLMMVELSVAIENSFHVQVPVAMLIKGPSLEELVEILRKEGQPESQSTGIEADLILPDEIKLRSHRQGHMKPKRVLLTGATGFLGQHLVETLMRSDVEKVSCLVRGDDGKSRLKQSVNDQDGLFEAKVEVINGDLSKPNWGLEEPLSTLLQSMDVVIHNGAAVNFIQPYEALRDTNVQSLLELLIASSENPPVLHFISTWAVFSSPAYAGKIIHENDWSEILPESGYRQSKYVAEQLVKQAIGRGFPIQVHRPALIGPHSETGERNPAEFFGALVSAALQTRTAPDIELLVPIASVDTITQGIVSSVLYGETYPHALHWCHHEPMKWKDLVAWLSQQQPIELVPYPEWRTQMAQLKHSTFSAFLPLLPENLVEGDFGYLRAAIKGNAPEVFEVNRTAALFPELESNSDFSFKVMEAFIKKM
ncbi:MAG: thioester reductase domain-containing protein, partial [Deferribacteres bacterium]|nr:thioester reductase domain-containing protein [Deferribacteres bacterium]